MFQAIVLEFTNISMALPLLHPVTKKFDAVNELGKVTAPNQADGLVGDSTRPKIRD
jgi:hypothetical protein